MVQNELAPQPNLKDYKHRMLERMKEEVLQEAEEAAAENVRDTSPNAPIGKFRH